MAITYRADGPWGSGKGANLTPVEVDSNFWQLVQDVTAKAPQGTGIDNITVSGDQMTVVLTDHTLLGPYTLPTAQLTFRGEWLASTQYYTNDIFTHGGKTYIVEYNHTSAATFDPAANDGAGHNYYTLILDNPAGALPTGGATNQILTKTSGVDYATTWTNNDLLTLADVDQTTTPAIGNTLNWDGTLWTFSPPSTTFPSLDQLTDVTITSATDQQVLRFDGGSLQWKNTLLGTMADQSAAAVAITGGSITGLPNPTNATDAAPKSYVDLVAAGLAPIVNDGYVIANVTGSSATPVGVAQSAVLDHVLGSTTRGAIMYRAASAWLALAPGAAGTFLQTNGAGADPTWAAGIAGITRISAGPGISTGGADITSSGTISLAGVNSNQILANLNPSIQPPSGVSLSALLDVTIASTQGAILFRGASGWSGLAAGTAGQYLKTMGSASNPTWDSPAGSGTVVNVATGTGLTGGPITSTGTIALAPIADSSVLGNTSGGTAAPTPTSTSALLDHSLGSSQGSVAYRGASGWSALGPGTTGQFLQTNGVSANPTWGSVAGATPIPNQQIMSNISGGSAVATGHTLSNILDNIISSTRGALLFRGAAGWSGLAAGTTGQFLQTNGALGDPAWAAATATTPPISNQQILANISGGSAVPTGQTLSAILDNIISSTRGELLFRGASGWSGLAAGTTGQFLQTNGTSGDPAWAGVTTPPISNQQILANLSGGSASPTGQTLSAILDNIISSARGALLFRGATSWSGLAAGTAGQFLQTNGTSGDPTWAGTSTVSVINDLTDVTITSIADTDVLVYDNASSQWKNQRPKYNVGCYVPGIPVASQNLLFHKFSKAVTIPANFGVYLGHTSEAGAAAVATATTNIDVAKATAASPTTFSTVGTITFAAAAASATFTSTGGTTISFAQGDIMRIRAPLSPDATLADFFATIVGRET